MSKGIYLSVASLLLLPVLFMNPWLTHPQVPDVGGVVYRWVRAATSADALLMTAIIVYFIGGVIKGTFGIGMGLIAVSIMAMVVDPKIAIVLFIFPVLLTNAWQAFKDGRVKWIWDHYWRLASSMIVVMTVTSMITAKSSVGLSTLLIGSVAITFACVNMGITFPALPRRLDRRAQVFAGCLAGFMGGVSGLVVIPLVAYLTLKQTEKNEFVATMGFLLMLSGLVLALTFWRAGVLTSEIAGFSMLLVIPAMAGAFLGEKAREVIPTPLFRKLILIVILIIGFNLVRRGILLGL